MALVLSGLVLISYANSLSNGFAWDDHRQVVMNPDLRGGAPWGRLFSSDVWGFQHQGQPARSNYYRPLQMVAYRLTATVAGFEAYSFHLLSIVFAVATVMAAFYVFLQLTQRTMLAFSAAALFAVHPVHSEAVDWISALPELGCGAFLLLAFGLFLYAERATSGATISEGTEEHRNSISPRLCGPLCSLWLKGLSLLAFAAALLWKETAVVFPLLVIAYFVCLGAGSLGARIKTAAKLSLPYWCVLAAYFVLRFWALGFLAFRQRIWDLTPVQSGLSALYLMVQYWWKLILPIPLNAYHLFTPVRSLTDPRALLAIALLIAMCGLLVYGFRRRPLFVFAALWVFITLLPVMDIYAVGRNAFAERYLYLPSAGLCLLLIFIAASALTRLPPSARAGAGAALLVAVIAACMAATLDHNPAWKDDATLFGQTLRVSPDAPFVHYMLASTAADDNAAAQSAENHYLRAISLAQAQTPPDLLDATMAYKGLASLYADRDNYDRALELLGQVRRLSPDDPDVAAEEGLILVRAGRWQQAEPLLNQAITRNPRDENALNALALLTWQYKHNLPEAAVLFTRALDVHSSYDDFRASLHNNLGGVYGDLRQFPQAMQQFKSAVALSPSDPEYRTNLATALAAMGRYDDAVTEATTALRATPNYPPALGLLQQLQRR